MSPLVKAIIKSTSVPGSSAKGVSLSDQLSNEFPLVDSDLTEVPRVWENLLPYVESALAAESRPTSDDDKRTRATLLFKTGLFNAKLKRYKLAVKALKDSLDLREKDTNKDSKLIEQVKVALC